ncbi:MAG: YlxR family protein [Propionibacteriaceae bacterium]|nr:YlxR family protein [Propionibacteriaceae bacterium]
MSGPVRTCVGCRRKAPKTALLRLVAGPDGGVLVDHSQTAPGRGAYAHPDCVAQAMRKRVLERALRVSLAAQYHVPATN